MISIDKVLRNLKVDSLLNRIKKSANHYQFMDSVRKRARLAIYLTGGAPIPNEEPLLHRRDFYLILDAQIPQRYFNWAEKK